MSDQPLRQGHLQDSGHRILHLKLDTQLRATRPPLVELVKLWYLRRGADGMPPRSAFDAQTLKAFLPHIFISEFETATQRYRYRLIGTALTEAFARNATGHYFDEVYSTPDLHDLRDILDAARLSGEPKTVGGRMTFTNRASIIVEALLLPVGVAEGQNPQLLGALYFSAPETIAPARSSRMAAFSLL